MSAAGFKVALPIPFTRSGFVTSRLYVNGATAMKKESNRAVQGRPANDAEKKPVMNRVGAHHAPGENLYAALNKAPAPSANVKGSRTAAHGHSRAK
jgi:hypothetical protein